MKFSPLSTCIALLALVVLIVIWNGEDPVNGGVATVESGGEQAEGTRGTAIRGGAMTNSPVRRADARVAPEAVVPLVPEIVEAVATQVAPLLTLPGGGSLPLVVERRERDVDGEIVSVEGTVTQPAPGRFMFRRQPEGALPGPLVGFVFYPSLSHGYRVVTRAGQSVLVESSVHDIACVQFGPPADLVQEEGIPADHPRDVPIPEYQNGVIPLESLPSAVGVIYLDFDGEEGPHTSWGDFDAASHNASNNQIFDVWRRVSEDLAPFNLNVTTDLQVYLDAPETSRQRVIITPTTTASPGSGGVAYVGSFNWSGDTPCWAFYGTGKNAAEVISHEIGHTLSLSHDGRTSPSEGYYGGHGSGETGWAPIMGVGYYKQLTQWSKGEYLNANRTQDDLARIVDRNNLVDYRDDDHEASHATASPLDFEPGGGVDDEGTIETDGDVDAFLFTTTTGGALNVSIDQVTAGANVDLLVELFDDNGTMLQSSNPANELDAQITHNVGVGTYTIRVTNTGKGDPLETGYTSYASLGQYTLSGTIPGVVLPEWMDVNEGAANGTVVGTVVPRNAHGGNPLSYSIGAGNSLGAFQINPTTGEITVANGSVLDVEILSSGWDEEPVFDLTVDIVDGADAGLNESIRVLVEVLDGNEAPSISGTSLVLLEHTRVGRVLDQLIATDPDQLDTLTYAITAGDPNGRFEVDGAGYLSVAGDLDHGEQSSYSLTVTATDEGGLSAEATVTVEVIDTVEGYVPGGVQHAFYRGISGNLVADLLADADYPRCPDDISERDEIHADGDGSSYGRVIRSYLIPPSTGTYTFWIAGDDGCELLLSTDESAGNAVSIAGFTGSTGYQVWTRYSGQQSAGISLVGGQAYYLEVRQKQGGGDDHVSVAWEIRDPANALVQTRTPVSGLFLAPYEFNYCPRLDDQTASIRDNVYPGKVLHQFAVDDLNGGDAHTYEISSGDPEGRFSIDPLTGAVRLSDASDLAASYLLTVTATDDGVPAQSGTATLEVEVISGEVVTATGPLMEFWDNLSGNNLSTLVGSSLYPDRPERLTELTDFDSGSGLGSNYGARVRAYLTPEASGDYTFYLATDDEGSLRLSTDEDPANATEIASVSGWASYKQWDKFPSQTSAPVSLVAGQRYFIEGLIKEGGGGDHLTVAWTGPGISSITVLDSSVLEPFDSNVAPTLAPLDQAYDLPTGVLAGTIVESFSAVDSPFEDLAFAILGGDEAGAFAMDPLSGVLSVEDPGKLHSGPYVLTVGVQDSGHGGYFPLRDATSSVVIYIDDLDHDMLPDTWELEQFGVTTQIGRDDPDGDAFDNRSEFVFGSVADQISSYPQGPKPNGVGAPGAYRFSMDVRKNLPPRSVDVYSSADLSLWVPLELGVDYIIVEAAPIDEVRERLTLEVYAPGPECFLKAAASSDGLLGTGPEEP